MEQIKDVKLTLSVKNNDPTVRDYNIYNRRVVPGLLLIDSIYTFLMSKGYVSNKALMLKDILFKKPIIASEGVIVKLQIHIRALNEGYFINARSQRNMEGEEKEGIWEENFQCTINFEEENAENKKIDMAKLNSNIKKTIGIDRIYETARECGVIHKEFMLTKGQIYEKEDYHFAKLDLSEIGLKHVDSFYIHPAYTYAGIAMLYYLVSDKIDKKRAFVPMYIESLKFYTNLKNSAYLKIEPQKIELFKDETLISDMELYDELGNLSVEAKGISMSVLEDNTLAMNVRMDKEKKPEIVPEKFDPKYLSSYAKKVKSIRRLIENDLKKIISTIIRVPEKDISKTEYFLNMGFDSKLLLEFAYRLDIRMGKKINPTILFGNPTVEALSGYIDKYLRYIYEEQFRLLGKEDSDEDEDEDEEITSKNTNESEIKPADDLKLALDEMNQSDEFFEDEDEDEGEQSLEDLFEDENNPDDDGFSEDILDDVSNEGVDGLESLEDLDLDDDFEDESKGLGLDDEFEDDSKDLDLDDELEDDSKELDLDDELEDDSKELDLDEEFEDELQDLELDEESEDSSEKLDLDEDLEELGDNGEKELFDESQEDKTVDEEFLKRVIMDIKLVMSELTDLHLGIIDSEEWVYSKELDSDVLMEFMNKLNAKVEGRVSPAALFRYEKLELLAQYLVEEFASSYVFEKSSEELNQSDTEQSDFQESDNFELELENDDDQNNSDLISDDDINLDEDLVGVDDKLGNVDEQESLDLFEIEDLEDLEGIEDLEVDNREAEIKELGLDDDSNVLEDIEHENESYEGDDALTGLELEELDLESSSFTEKQDLQEDYSDEDDKLYDIEAQGADDVAIETEEIDDVLDSQETDDYVLDVQETDDVVLDESSEAYIIDGTKSMPFAYFIKEVIELAQKSNNETLYTGVKDLQWGQPVKQIDFVNISTTFLEEADGLRFFVYSELDDGSKCIHLKGKLVDETRVKSYYVDVDDIRSRLDTYQEDDIYERLMEMGIKPSGQLETIEFMDKGFKEVVSVNKIDKKLTSNSEMKFRVLESVVQTLLLNSDYSDKDKDKFYAPFICKEICFRDDVDCSKFYVYAKEVLRSKRHGTIMFSVRVIDTQGRIICRAKEFNIKMFNDSNFVKNTRIIEDEGVIMGQIKKELHENSESKYSNEPIAIIGLSGVLPKAQDVAEFFENLVGKNSLIGELPNKRRELMYSEKEYNPKEAQEIMRGGYVEDIQSFDAKFFGIEELEARFMDPQQRLLLQNTWNAVEDAGYRMSQLANSKTGVFIGASSNEYESIVLKNVKRLLPEMFYGLSQFYIANRISKTFDLRGPSEVLNTGNTSSLTAIKRAVDELHNGTCDVAIVGSTNIILSDEKTKLLNNLGKVSRSGQVKPLDESADGLLRSEGVGVVVLKPLEKAMKSSDNIYGVIKGVDVGFAGDSSKKDGQEQIVLDAWEKANINPLNLDYIELSADGILDEDKLEIQMLKNAFSKSRPLDESEKILGKENVLLGSGKSYFGNAEASSGMLSLFNVLMSMKYEKKLGILNLKQPNPDIALDGTSLEIMKETDDWVNLRDENGKKAKIAGINCTGFGGMLGHMVVEEHLQEQMEQSKGEYEHMFVFSAKNEMLLKEYVKKFLIFIRRDGKNVSLEDVEFTLQIGREAMGERLVVVAKTILDLEKMLKAYLDGKVDNENSFAGNIKVNKTKFVPIFNGEEADAFVRLLMENKNYKNLAQLWILGIEFDWKQLHVGRRVKRISLPGYQFRGPKYWYSEKKVSSQQPGSVRQVEQQKVSNNDVVPKKEDPKVPKKEEVEVTKKEEVEVINTQGTQKEEEK